ncbi:Uncharacterised protein [Bordetella pertussis]|nr:Uncharacterised protein [Bordetella pertussis]CFW55331.1 Uncharacterised protein [Bordetella pertussis]CPN95586.1 Uncharacterised protein [Bordetella pertussis]CPP36157.1 Uncharacterised protein [Bordetella pertussis]CRE17759.1 Uncharacterised protein [Bordetella pertussis]
MTGSTNCSAEVRMTSRAWRHSSSVNGRSTIAMSRSRASSSTAARVQPGRMSCDSGRTTISPAALTSSTLDDEPSVTTPCASTITASKAPRACAACLASTWASSDTLLMSRRCQRRSGTVATCTPLCASGLTRRSFSLVNSMTVGSTPDGNAKSRLASAPRVTCT